jgi:hypothetical protein
MFKPARDTLGDRNTLSAVRGYVSSTIPRLDPIEERASVRLHRVVYAAVILVGLTVLSIAAWLEPDPSGMATHTQLGLKACGMMVKTGLPCPTCGMTTAFAWAAEGRIDKAIVTQPAGALLAVLTGSAVLLCSYLLVTGRRIGPLLSDILVVRFVLFLGGAIVLGWAYKLVSVIL